VGPGLRRAPRVLTVSELSARIQGTLEEQLGWVWVSGELSGCKRSAPGHLWFCLKDDQAQIRAVMWRSAASRIKFDLADGLDVICHGHIDVYAPRGSYQLVAGPPPASGKTSEDLFQLHGPSTGWVFVACEIIYYILPSQSQ